MRREASSSVSEKIAFVATRILNDPVFCRFSHLKNSSAPHIASSVADRSTGVRCICNAIRAWAASIASHVGADGCELGVFDIVLSLSPWQLISMSGMIRILLPDHYNRE